MEDDKNMKKYIKIIVDNKGKIIAAVSAVFGLAASLGSTILTPEQREGILNAIPKGIALLGALFG